MTTDVARPRRTWLRAELEVLANDDEPEGSLELFRVRVTPRLLLLLMDYQGERGEGPIEVVSVGMDSDVSLRFYGRDTRPETARELRDRVLAEVDRKIRNGVRADARLAYEEVIDVLTGVDRED